MKIKNDGDGDDGTATAATETSDIKDPVVSTVSESPAQPAESSPGKLICVPDGDLLYERLAKAAPISGNQLKNSEAAQCREDDIECDWSAPGFRASDWMVNNSVDIGCYTGGLVVNGVSLVVGGRQAGAVAVAAVNMACKVIDGATIVASEPSGEGCLPEGMIRGRCTPAEPIGAALQNGYRKNWLRLGGENPNPIQATKDRTAAYPPLP